MHIICIMYRNEATETLLLMLFLHSRFFCTLLKKFLFTDSIVYRASCQYYIYLGRLLYFTVVQSLSLTL